MLLCCKNLPVLLWGPFFVGAPVRPNMLNMPKSASGDRAVLGVFDEHQLYSAPETSQSPVQSTGRACIGAVILHHIYFD